MKREYPSNSESLKRKVSVLPRNFLAMSSTNLSKNPLNCKKNLSARQTLFLTHTAQRHCAGFFYTKYPSLKTFCSWALLFQVYSRFPSPLQEHIVHSSILFQPSVKYCQFQHTLSALFIIFFLEVTQLQGGKNIMVGRDGTYGVLPCTPPPSPPSSIQLRCNVSPSLTDVSPTENSWMLRPLDKVSLDYFAPDRTIPSLNSDLIGVLCVGRACIRWRGANQ